MVKKKRVVVVVPVRHLVRPSEMGDMLTMAASCSCLYWKARGLHAAWRSARGVGCRTGCELARRRGGQSCGGAETVHPLSQVLRASRHRRGVRECPDGGSAGMFWLEQHPDNAKEEPAGPPLRGKKHHKPTPPGATLPHRGGSRVDVHCWP